MTITKLDKYIFIQSLIGFIIAISALSVAIIMVDLVEQMRAISGVPNTNFNTALYFTFMRLPGLIEQTTPVTILIASILTFTGLSRKSEIIAMRAAGISAWRFLAPLGTLAVAIGVFIVIFIGPLASQLNRNYENLKDNMTRNVTIKTENSKELSWTTMPIKDGQIVISGIQNTDKTGNKSYKESFIIQLSKDGNNFIRRIDAKKIEFAQNQILAHDVIINEIGKEANSMPLITLEFDIDNSNTTYEDVKTMPFWELPNAAHKAKISGGSPQKYWLRFYRLVTLPITMLAIALFAGLMSIGLDRSGGKARAVFIAICVGLLMYFINDLAALLATSGKIPAFVAAFFPPIFILSSTLYLLSFKED